MTSGLSSSSLNYSFIHQQPMRAISTIRQNFEFIRFLWLFFFSFLCPNLWADLDQFNRKSIDTNETKIKKNDENVNQFFLTKVKAFKYLLNWTFLLFSCKFHKFFIHFEFLIFYSFWVFVEKWVGKYCKNAAKQTNFLFVIVEFTYIFANLLKHAFAVFKQSYKQLNGLIKKKGQQSEQKAPSHFVLITREIEKKRNEKRTSLLLNQRWRDEDGKTNFQWFNWTTTNYGIFWPNVCMLNAIPVYLLFVIVRGHQTPKIVSISRCGFYLDYFRLCHCSALALIFILCAHSIGRSFNRFFNLYAYRYFMERWKRTLSRRV